MFWKAIFIVSLGVAALGEENKPTDYRIYLSSLFKVECQNNTNNKEKFDYFEETGDAFYNCLKNFMDLEAAKSEIEQAKTKDALDVVFKKYCENEAQMKTCVRNVLDGLAPCVNTTGQGQLDSAKKITDEFINFACYNDGDRIATFIAERGPACYISQINEVQECNSKLEDNTSNFISSPNLSTAEKCSRFDQFAPCIAITRATKYCKNSVI
ncbi:hypothetical protein K1T71_004331 [Dendrolimus kikuchii]|uniref:Uncharacterized protein n=1 Tax=Dendrolimus kikuchii TaxID=765133 RepID=A0ACC1D7E0_9NEOP|nr:hypothetical protein K1T71_004331 [Dendrolimus kikuchii]